MKFYHLIQTDCPSFFQDIKRKLALITLLCCCSYSFSFAQTQFQTVIADPNSSLEGQSIFQVSDGYIVAGPNSSSAPSNSTIIKTNLSGSVVWNKKLHGFTIQKAKPTSDGGYIIVASGDATPNANINTVLKLDGSGNTQWSKNYTASPSFGFRFYDIIQTVHGANTAYVVVGSIGRPIINGTGGYADDFFTMKISATGAVIWSHTYGRNYYAVGDILYERAHAVIEIPSSDPLYPNYVVTGECDNWANSINDALYVVKVNGSNGSIIFDKVYYEQQNAQYYSYKNTGFGIVKDSNGDFIISGPDVTKINSTGNILWCKRYGSKYVTLDGSGTGYAFVGSQTVIHTNSSGTVDWAKTYGTAINFSLNALSSTTDGGYIVAGKIPVSNESDRACLFLSKTNNLGASNCFENSVSVSPSTLSLLVANMNGTDTDIASTLTVTDGSFLAPVCLKTYSRSCSTGTDFTLVSTQSPISAYTVSEETSGPRTLYYINEADETWPAMYSIKWTLIEGTSSNPVYTNVTDLSEGGAYSYYTVNRTNAGFRYFINGTVRTDKTLCVDVIQANGCNTRQCYGLTPPLGGNNFRTGNNTEETNRTELLTQITLSPNPARDQITLSLPENIETSVVISDLNGVTIKSAKVDQLQNTINVSELREGMYLVTLTQDNDINTYKLQIVK